MTIFATFLCFVFADRGELHRVAVVDQNTTLLQEIPLFGSQEPVNNIVLHQVENSHAAVSSYRHDSFMHRCACCTSPGSCSGGQPPVSGSSPG